MRQPGKLAADDVRMRGFANRHTVDAALEWLDAQLAPLAAEDVPVRVAAGRVLAVSVVSGVDVPGFDRATMDGYALVSGSTEGAGAYNRLPLTVIGDSMPACPFDGFVSLGEAVRVMTGAPIPRGADAVLPAEWVDAAPGGNNSIAALAAVSPGKNVGRRGEDILHGTPLFQPGRVLRPQDLGVLSSIGQADARVVSPAACTSCGDRQRTAAGGIAPPWFSYRRCQWTHARRADRARRRHRRFPRSGSRRSPRHPRSAPVRRGRCHRLRRIERGHRGSRAMLVAQYGDLAVHGIAMRPSSPTGLGRIGNRLVFLLPGNPVSSLCAYDFFAGRAIRALGGRSKVWPYLAIRGTLSRKISSPIGRLDYARVKIAGGVVEPLAMRALRCYLPPPERTGS